MTGRPILSVCIPAYGYEAGVRRILTRFADVVQSSDRLEILVSEDKSDRPLGLLDLREKLNFDHHVNQNPTGAIANWNAVMARASGQYIWLLHHDEEPVFVAGFENFLDMLEYNAPIDCLISDLKLADRWWQRGLRHDALRKIFVRFPVTILAQNYIGAPSNIIFHRSLKADFDSRLNWLVDVEWYYRLFGGGDARRRFSFSQFAIITHPYSDSITQNISDRVGELALREAKLIGQRHALNPFFRGFWHCKLLLSNLVKQRSNK